MSDTYGSEHDERRSTHVPEHQTQHSEREPHLTVTGAEAPIYSHALLGDSKLEGWGNAPVHSAVMQSAQQKYGNRAVQRFIAAQRSVPATAGFPGSVPVQRQYGDDPLLKGRHSRNNPLMPEMPDFLAQPLVPPFGMYPFLGGGVLGKPGNFDNKKTPFSMLNGGQKGSPNIKLPPDPSSFKSAFLNMHIPEDPNIPGRGLSHINKPSSASARVDHSNDFKLKPKGNPFKKEGSLDWSKGNWRGGADVNPSGLGLRLGYGDVGGLPKPGEMMKLADAGELAKIKNGKSGPPAKRVGKKGWNVGGALNMPFNQKGNNPFENIGLWGRVSYNF
ncbi:MAG TPA: hypothetical protein VJ183_06230 [Chloroflexia bacterium]|nr:hypothetical protein [Chloroflexia bacterium]